MIKTFPCLAQKNFVPVKETLSNFFLLFVSVFVFFPLKRTLKPENREIQRKKTRQALPVEGEMGESPPSLKFLLLLVI